jgi:8-oxoguanine deaminase
MLGRDDIGAIAVGMQADLALFTLDEPSFSGAQDPIAALVLCGAHRADRVMVANRWRVIDGEPEGVDLAALIAKHKAVARAFAEEIWTLRSSQPWSASAESLLAP